MKEYKCPYCKRYFKPKRLNQLYCENKHGWTHRNILKTSTNKQSTKLQLGLLKNLKKLNSFSFSSCQFVDREILSSMDLDLDCLVTIKNPKNSACSDQVPRWFEVHGYVINMHATGHCTLYSPSFFKI
jgi:hypothetical protein